MKRAIPSIFAECTLLFTLFCSVFLVGMINTYQLLGGAVIGTIGLALSFNPQISKRKTSVNTAIEVFILVIAFTVLFSKDRSSSVKYLLLWITIYCEVLFGRADKQYQKRVANYFLILCLIECVFITLQYLFPAQLNRIISRMLSQGALGGVMEAFDLHGACTGIAGTQPFAMFYAYIVFCMGIIRCTRKMNIYNALLAGFGLFNIFLSGKRSAIAITMLAIIYMGVFAFKRDKAIGKKWKVLLVCMMGVGGFVLFNTNIGFAILEKNNTLRLSGDISNGRFFLISQMFNIFKENPIMGIGPLATNRYYGAFLGHNIYFQTLCEMGIVGFIALCTLLIVGLNRKIQIIQSGRGTEFDLLSAFIQLFFIIYGFFGNPLFSYVFIIPYIMFVVE